MDEYQAWTNFINTGSIQDYLLYNRYKRNLEKSSQGDVNDASSDKRFSSQRVMRRR